MVGWAPSDAGTLPAVELTSLYVDSAHRGTDVASRLLDVAIGAEPAFLWVFVDNARTHASYAKQGFEPDGHRSVDPGTGVLEQRMVRE